MCNLGPLGFRRAILWGNLVLKSGGFVGLKEFLGRYSSMIVDLHSAGA